MQEIVLPATLVRADLGIERTFNDKRINSGKLCNFFPDILWENLLSQLYSFL